jgi:TP901 family phage tail tape measure protein
MSHAEAAESFFFLASAGLDAQQSIEALPQVAAFAKAGMFDMATATDLATDAQSALGLTVDDAQQNLVNLTRVTDVFAKANALANTSVEQVANAITTKAGVALRSVNKDLEEAWQFLPYLLTLA